VLTILSVGEDFDLLRTRAEVLRKPGANVLCSTGAAALKFIAEWDFDLIILCHSVRRWDAIRITEAAHRRGSKALVSLLVSDPVEEQEFDGISFDAKTFVEPACLIRSTAELLNRQAPHDPVEMPRDGKIKLHLGRKMPTNYPADIAARRALKAGC
jgi:DNA-binding response OmpR family regulator